MNVEFNPSLQTDLTQDATLVHTVGWIHLPVLRFHRLRNNKGTLGVDNDAVSQYQRR